MLFRFTWLAVVQTFIWFLLSATGYGRLISTWYTGLGAPQIAMYDNSTGKIFYSLCNSNSTPVFPANDTAAFYLNIAPANNTSVAGIGYEQDGKNVAALHYISTGGGIVQALYTCDETGHYVWNPSQAWIVSVDIQPPVEPQRDTDLAAVVVGESGGYRIYYRDKNNSVSVLQYTRSSNTDDSRWSYGYHVSQEEYTGASIQAGFVNADRITVITSLVSADQGILFNHTIQVCTSQGNDWLQTSFPYASYDYKKSQEVNQENDNDVLVYSQATNNTKFDDIHYQSETVGDTLEDEAYNGNETKLGLAFDSRATRNIFYIGTDSSLYQFQENSTNDDDDSSATPWVKVDPPRNDDDGVVLWPRADIPSPDFAVAYKSDLDKIWIFYMVNGTMTQVHQSSAGVWEPAVALPKFNATAASEPDAPTAGDGDGDDPASSDGGGGGLSSSGKVGVGVGVGLGLPIIGALVAAYIFWHTRRSRQNRASELAAVQEAHAAATSPSAATATTSFLGASTGSPAPGYSSGYWSGGEWMQPYSDQQQQMFAGKPDGQWPQQQFIDPRLSQLYAGTPQPQPQPPVHEMPHQEPMFEVAGDGQVPEMPGSPSVPAPAPAPAPAVSTAPAPSLSPAPPTSPSHRAVSPLPDTDAQPK